MKKYLGFLLLLIIVSCEIVNEKQPNKITLNLNANLFEEQAITIDSLKLNFTANNDFISITKTDVAPVGIIEITNLWKQRYSIEVTMYCDNGTIYKAISKIDFDSTKKISGDLYTENGFTKIILKLDTNPRQINNTDTFKNISIRSAYFKEFEIHNADSIAEAYLQTPMKYFAKHLINYDILDENMIPIISYDFGDFRNPVSTAHNAYACYEEFINTGDQQYLDWFYTNVDWLIDYKDEDSYLRYEFDWYHYYGLMEAGWISAMAQGEALAAACMAYHASGDEKYLEAAEDFFTVMYVNKDRLWCFGIDDEDYLWYEEYPNVDFCHVLNGKLFGMWGLWDYYCITGDEFALSLFQGGLASVLDNYPMWNFVGSDGSRYCQHENSCSNYHPVHLDELRKYRDFFNIDEFNDIIETFTEF